MIRGCADRGLMIYSWVQFCYGKAWLEVLDADEIWLLTLESGRYPDWEEELRIVGNLITGTPILVDREMCAEAFQETLFMVRSGPYLSDVKLLFDQKWLGLYEGIVSNEFALLPGDIEMEILEEQTRAGSSMYFENGALEIELRHMDMSTENERYRLLKERLEIWLRTIL